MLAIRLQRTGRKGHAQFRMIVQDSRRSPSSGRVVHYLGSYNPHSKTAQIDTEKAAFYLKNGARPSDRAARLLKAEGVKLPSWVELEGKKKGALRNPDKLRKNRPADAEAPDKAQEADEAEEATEAPAETEAVAEAPAEEAPAKEAVAEAPADQKPAEAEDKPTDEPAEKA